MRLNSSFDDIDLSLRENLTEMRQVERIDVTLLNLLVVFSVNIILSLILVSSRMSLKIQVVLMQ